MAAGSRGILAVCRLDGMSYARGLAAMECLAALRQAGEVPDIMLHVQHTPVYTIGKRGLEEDILASAAELESLGVEVHRTPRGGEVTFHGPGQAVMYPVCSVRGLGVGARRFVEGMEDAMIGAVARHGIVAHGRLEGATGVWVGEPVPTRKIGAIGVRISRGVSTHGMALNICPDLSFFDHIVPCGAAGDKEVTSVARELELAMASAAAAGAAPVAGAGGVDYDQVAGELVGEFAGVFGFQGVRDMEPGELWSILGSEP